MTIQEQYNILHQLYTRLAHKNNVKLSLWLNKTGRFCEEEISFLLVHIIMLYDIKTRI